MLTPTAIPTDPALLPVVPATPVAPTPDAGEVAMPVAPLPEDAFAAMLGTLLTSADNGSTPPPSGAAAPTPLVTAPAVSAAQTLIAGGAEPIDSDEGASAEEPTTASVDWAEDAETLTPEDVAASGWMFLMPAPTDLPVPVVTASEPVSSNAVAKAGDAAMPEIPEQPAGGRDADPFDKTTVLADTLVDDPEETLVANETPSTAPEPVRQRAERAFVEGAKPEKKTVERPDEPTTASITTVPAVFGSEPRMPAANSVAYQARRDNIPVAEVAKQRASALATPAAEVSAHFAGKALPTTRRGGDDGVTGAEKVTQPAEGKRVGGQPATVGIESANVTFRMPEETSPLSPVPLELPPVAASAEAEANHAPAAVRAVEKVVDVAEMLVESGRESVQLRLDFGEAGPLTVRVSLREGEIHAVFRSDSTDVREALAVAWDQLSTERSSADAFVPLAEPEFLPLREIAPVAASPHDGSMQSRSDGQSGGRQQAPAQSAPEFFSSSPRGAARAGEARRETDDTPRSAAASSHHLRAFA